MNHIKRVNYSRLSQNVYKLFMAPLTIFTTVLVITLMDLPLTSQYIYSVRSICSRLTITVSVMMPVSLIRLADVKVSVNRIEKFLLNDYQKPNKLRSEPKSFYRLIDNSVFKIQKPEAVVRIDRASVKWDQSLTGNVLSDITFTAASGELVGVVGTTGSGKSTLLQMILKEMDLEEGNVSVRGTISYAPQDSWIFSASIRQNILFGQDMDKEKYHRVLRCCALERDLSLFPHGDQTLVGERGIMLSGGQKARVNLARAVYRDADIYLLDDPLSAVDSHVARHIFETCFLDYLKNKCIVLVTHQIQFLHNISKIYLLQQQKLVELNERDKLFALFTEETKNALEIPKSIALTECDSPSQVPEHRSTGKSTKVYKRYCQSVGHWSITCTAIFVFILLQILTSCVEFFLTFWLKIEQRITDSKAFFTRKNCLYIYTSLVTALFFVILASIASFVKYCDRASKKLHNSLLTKVIFAPMTFFNHHSSGRILNRFSRDIGAIDEILPLSLINVFTGFFTIVGTVILVSIINYYTILPSAVLLLIIFFLCVVLKPTSTSIKRTEAISKSQICRNFFLQQTCSEEFHFCPFDSNHARTEYS
jgi:ATP-binding cassette subfamily C (CFTR/MRP) protein 4